MLYRFVKGYTNYYEYKVEADSIEEATEIAKQHSVDPSDCFDSLLTCFEAEVYENEENLLTGDYIELINLR